MDTTVNDSTYHIMIIWSTALSIRDKVVDDLKDSFSILKIVKIHWDRDKFLDNYTIFYAHSQKYLNRNALNKLLKNKINHCGNDDFIAIIFEDKTPIYDYRQTSSGRKIVNTRVFDKKSLYRSWSGGGHKIHASDDDWETNKDLTILFGLNTTDFLHNFCDTTVKQESEYRHNCIGVGGYDSIEQLFYVLNNTCEYVVLRNHEVIPEQYTVDGHGDIDLLVENKNYVAYITLARPVYNIAYRVYHAIRIGGIEVPFDFRYVGDNYYDRYWEEHILKQRHLAKDLLYIPSDEDQFYSLLYHAFLQKSEVKPDYYPKLEYYGKQIGINFDGSANQAIQLLDDYMKANGYEVVRPSDLSVFYNTTNLQLSTYALRHGVLKKHLVVDDYYSKVFEKKCSFIKLGTPKLIENEARFLKQLSNYPYFPTLIRFESDKEECFIEISRKAGVSFNQFFGIEHHKISKNIYDFIRESICILKILADNKIIHRDFIPTNILIDNENGALSISLIDFGWSIYVSEIDCCEKPLHLADIYAHPTDFSDFYTLGKILKIHFGYRKRAKQIGDLLCTIDSKVYQDEIELSRRINLISSILAKPKPIQDYYYDIRSIFKEVVFFIFKYLKLIISKLKHKINILFH